MRVKCIKTKEEISCNFNFTAGKFYDVYELDKDNEYAIREDDFGNIYYDYCVRDNNNKVQGFDKKSDWSAGFDFSSYYKYYSRSCRILIEEIMEVLNE
jgi:hypothetical protein